MAMPGASCTQQHHYREGRSAPPTHVSGSAPTTPGSMPQPPAPYAYQHQLASACVCLPACVVPPLFPLPMLLVSVSNSLAVGERAARDSTPAPPHQRTLDAQRLSVCSHTSRRSRPLMPPLRSASCFSSGSDSCCAYCFRIMCLRQAIHGKGRQGDDLSTTALGCRGACRKLALAESRRRVQHSRTPLPHCGYTPSCQCRTPRPLASR